jgi:hypothetical protein
LSLLNDGNEKPKAKSGYNDLLDQDELTRFDGKRRKKKKKKSGKPKPEAQNDNSPRNEKNE